MEIPKDCRGADTREYVYSIFIGKPVKGTNAVITNFVPMPDEIQKQIDKEKMEGFKLTSRLKKWWGWPKQRIPRKLKKKLKKLGKYVKPPNARTTHREVYFTKPAYTLNINDKRYIK